jgi:hypothetical protein
VTNQQVANDAAQERDEIPKHGGVNGFNKKKFDGEKLHCLAGDEYRPTNHEAARKLGQQGRCVI